MSHCSGARLLKVEATEQPAMTSHDPQREALIASLRERYASAERNDDSQAKQALFKEAVYLGIQPEQFTGEA